jgi:hypothetical protein
VGGGRVDSKPAESRGRGERKCLDPHALRKPDAASQLR